MLMTCVVLLHFCPHATRAAGHQSDVDVVSWHPNSQYVATGSSDRTVRLWDVSNGEHGRSKHMPVLCMCCTICYITRSNNKSC